MTHGLEPIDSAWFAKVTTLDAADEFVLVAPSANTAKPRGPLLPRQAARELGEGTSLTLTDEYQESSLQVVNVSVKSPQPSSRFHLRMRLNSHANPFESNDSRHPNHSFSSPSKSLLMSLSSHYAHSQTTTPRTPREQHVEWADPTMPPPCRPSHDTCSCDENVPQSMLLPSL